MMSRDEPLNRVAGGDAHEMPRTGAIGGHVPDKGTAVVKAGVTIHRAGEDQLTEVSEGASSGQADRRECERREVSAVVTRPLQLQARLLGALSAVRTHHERDRCPRDSGDELWNPC